MEHLNWILKAVLSFAGWLTGRQVVWVGGMDRAKARGQDKPVPCQRVSCYGLGVGLWDRVGAVRFKEQVEAHWDEP